MNCAFGTLIAIQFMMRKHQFIYKSKQSKNRRLFPFTLALSFSASGFAHEILHCFGAPDYYYSSTTITQEFVDECSTTTSEYYTDIMRTVNTGDSMSGLTFSALDAYYVGLIESSEDERVKDVITEYGLGKSVHETLS